MEFWSAPTIVAKMLKHRWRKSLLPYVEMQCIWSPDGIRVSKMVAELWAQNEINPVWNQESSVVPQGNPQRTLIIASTAATSITASCSAGHVCMCLPEKNKPFQHKVCYAHCARVTFKLFNITFNDISAHIQFVASANKSPKRQFA